MIHVCRYINGFVHRSDPEAEVLKLPDWLGGASVGGVRNPQAEQINQLNKINVG